MSVVHAVRRVVSGIHVIAAAILTARGAGAQTQPWTARWIWTDQTTQNQWVAFRKSFTLDAAPVSAPTPP